MLKYVYGDLLQAKEDIICHQTNEMGVMGGGIAYHIAKKYPNCEKAYANYCERYNNNYSKLRGKCLIWNNGKIRIANCFSQTPKFETDYKALKNIFNNLLIKCKNEGLTIAIPYKYGCGIANGKWEKVEKILSELSIKYGVDIVIYQLEK